MFTDSRVIENIREHRDQENQNTEIEIIPHRQMIQRLNPSSIQYNHY